MSGPSWNTLSSPTASDESVSRKTWSDEATIVSWRPTTETSWPR